MKFRYCIFILMFVAKLGFAQLPYTNNFMCMDSALEFGSILKDAHKGIVVRDFNRDGRQDIAIVVNKIATKELIFYTNNAATTTISTSLFNEYSTAPIAVTGTTTLSQNINGIAGGFFNIDSLPDIAFVNDNKLMIFSNNTATTGLNVPVTGSVLPSYTFAANFNGKPKFIKAADFNNDKKTDLVVFTESTASQLTMLVLRNTTTGFTPSFVLDGTFYPYPSSQSLGTVQDCDLFLRDINNDLNEDIILMYQTHSPHIAFGFVNTTASSTLSFNQFTFSPQGTFSITATSSVFKSCVVTRINTDNINDIIFGINPLTGNSIITYVHNSTSTLVVPTQTFVLPVVGDFIKDIVPIDLTGDLNKELIILTSDGSGNNRLLLYYFDPLINQFNTSAISIPLSNAFDSKMNELAVIDYNNDNRMDLIIKSWSKSLNTNMEHFYLIPNFANKSFISPTSYAICSNSNVVITPSLSFPGGNNFEWSLNTATINPVGTTLTHTLLPPLSTSINSYTFGFNFKLPYSGEKCSYKPITLSITALPAPTVNLTASDPTICAKNELTLTTTNNLATSYTVFPLIEINQPIITLNPTVTTNYTAVATGSNGCMAASVVQVSVHPRQQAEIALLTSYTICLKDSVYLKSNKVANSYLWSDGNVNSNYYFTPIVKGDYYIALTTKDENNCTTDPDIIQISVKDCSNKDTTIKTYHLITPNNDGLNDILFIENIQKFPTAEVTVYNRWGKQLFSKRSYNNASISWPAPNEDITGGTYYYTVTDRSILLLKGWIEILKN